MGGACVLLLTLVAILFCRRVKAAAAGKSDPYNSVTSDRSRDHDYMTSRGSHIRDDVISSQGSRGSEYHVDSGRTDSEVYGEDFFPTSKLLTKI